MKRSPKNSQLDEMVRAARSDVPPASFVEELRTLGLLSSGADGLGSVPGAENSLAPGAGSSGTALLGGATLKLVAGGIASAVLAGGLWVSGQLETGGASPPALGKAPETRVGVELSRGERATPPGEALATRSALEGAGPLPGKGKGAALGDGAGEGLEGADDNATLPLPPVFEPERRKGSRGTRGASAEERAPKVESTASPSRSEQILAEARLVDQARRALRSDAALALSLTERGAREFPSGAAATERSVIAIEALVRLGRKDEARARFQAFERANPNSFHLPYLRRMLGEN